MELLLQEILDTLRSQNNTIKLGFCEPPKTRYIYANRQYPDCLWYFWDGAKNTHEPIARQAITGYITNIAIEVKEFRGKDDPKLNISIKADRPYCLQVGIDTEVGKSLIYTLAHIPGDDFALPLTIAVEAGETEQVLFARVYKGNAAYYIEREDKPNYKALAQSLSDQFAAKTPPSKDLEVLLLTIADLKTDKDFSDASDVIGNLNLSGTEKAQAMYAWNIRKAVALPQAEISRLNTTMKGAIDALGWSNDIAKKFIAELFPGRTNRKELTFEELKDLTTALLDESQKNNHWS